MCTDACVQQTRLQFILSSEGVGAKRLAGVKSLIARQQLGPSPIPLPNEVNVAERQTVDWLKATPTWLRCPPAVQTTELIGDLV